MSFVSIARMAVARVCLALSVVICSVGAAWAQYTNDDFNNFAQSIQMRLNTGRAAGQINDADYSRIQSMYNSVDAIRRSYGNKKIAGGAQMSLLSSYRNIESDLNNTLPAASRTTFNSFGAGAAFGTAAGAGVPYGTSIPFGTGTGFNPIGGALPYGAQPATNIFGYPTTSSFPGSTASTSVSGVIAQPFPGMNVVDRGDGVAPYINGLYDRMYYGRNSNVLSQSTYNEYYNRLSQIAQAESNYRTIGWTPVQQTVIMNMLTKLDQDMSGQLHDYDKSVAQFWNARSRTWSKQWWLTPWGAGIAGSAYGTPGYTGNTFSEVDAYQNSIQQRLDLGMRTGQINQFDYNRYAQQFMQIDGLKRQYSIGGMRDNDRTMLMQLLTRLDTEISSKLRR